MKHILSLLLIVGFFGNLYAQYPNTSNKMRLGAQTTGDGLIFRTDSIPDWTPSSLNNAWLAIDTLTGNVYSYQGAEWRLEVAGDLRTVYPKVINKSGTNIKRGQPVMVDYNQVIQGDLIRILPADGSGTYSGVLTMGIASTDIADDAEGFITWFGYVREVKQSDIMETGDTVVVGDILYLSGTELGKLATTEPTAPKLRVTMALVVRKPNANNLTLLVRPSLNMDLGELNDVDLTGLNDGETIVWDSAGGKWIAGVATGGVVDTTVIATRAYADGKVDSTRLVADSILVYYIGGVEVGRDTINIPPAGVTSITAGVGLTGGTITSTGTIAADTSVLATQTYVTTRGYLTTEVDGSVTNEGRLSTEVQVAPNWVNLRTNTSASDPIIFITDGVTGLTLNGNTQSNGGIMSFANDTTVLSTRFYTNSKVDSTRLVQDSILVYYIGGVELRRDTISGVGGGGGGISGSGTTGTIPIWSSSTALGNSALTEASGSVTAGGTGFFRLPNGTTAQRPGTPAAGMTRYNTSNGALEYYGASAWEVPVKSSSETGLFTVLRITRIDANGRLAADFQSRIVPSTGLVALGSAASNVSGTNNFIFGNGAGQFATTGSNNIFMGANAGRFNSSGNSNNFIGNNAGVANSTGAHNNFFGFTAGTANTSGIQNNFFGQNAGVKNTTGDNNNFFGSFAGNENTIGNNNNFIGNNAGFRNTSGANNTFIGNNAGNNSAVADTLTGNNNTIVGVASGLNIEGAAAGNLILGNENNLPIGNGINQIVIKNLIFGTGASGTGTSIATGARVGINEPAPARTFHVTGEVRITDLTTDPPTRIVGADADGDLSAITIGSGLSLLGDTLTATATAPARQLANLYVQGAETVVGQFDIERIDLDNGFSLQTAYQTSEFVADSCGITYIGTDTAYVEVTAVGTLVSTANASINFGFIELVNGQFIEATKSSGRLLTSTSLTISTIPAFLQLAPNERLELAVENTTAGTPTITTIKASLTFKKL